MVILVFTRKHLDRSESLMVASNRGPRSESQPKQSHTVMWAIDSHVIYQATRM